MFVWYSFRGSRALMMTIFHLMMHKFEVSGAVDEDEVNDLILISLAWEVEVVEGNKSLWWIFFQVRRLYFKEVLIHAFKGC